MANVKKKNPVFMCQVYAGVHSYLYGVGVGIELQKCVNWKSRKMLIQLSWDDGIGQLSFLEMLHLGETKSDRDCENVIWHYSLVLPRRTFKWEKNEHDFCEVIRIILNRTSLSSAILNCYFITSRPWVLIVLHSAFFWEGTYNKAFF